MTSDRNDLEQKDCAEITICSVWFLYSSFTHMHLYYFRTQRRAIGVTSSVLRFFVFTSMSIPGERGVAQFD